MYVYICKKPNRGTLYMNLDSKVVDKITPVSFLIIEQCSEHFLRKYKEKLLDN
jgi:hypothetical protein